jgi:hypothetical protein
MWLTTLDALAMLVHQATQHFCIERSHRIFQLAQYEMNPKVVQHLVSGVERCYREVNSMFQHCSGQSSSGANISSLKSQGDPAAGLYLRTNGSKILPYSVVTAGEVAWSQFSISERPTARCFVDEVRGVELGGDSLRCSRA